LSDAAAWQKDTHPLGRKTGLKRQFLRPLGAVGEACGHVEVDEGAQNLRMDETGDEVEQRLAILAGHARGKGARPRCAGTRGIPEAPCAMRKTVRQAGPGA
jgi:hypothetical protein